MDLNEKYKSIFEEADTDKDGSVSLEEFIALFRKRGINETDKSIAKMFSEADFNGDKKISLEEFLLLMNGFSSDNTTSYKEAIIRGLFNSFDKNGNGFIEKLELDQMFREMGKFFPPEEITRMVGLMDKDGDEKITYEEFKEHFFPKK